MKTRSWLKVNNKVPFRSMYFYWDKEPFLGDVEFVEEGVKVRFLKDSLGHPDYSFVGVFITCWSWDEEKVERAMDRLYDRLIRLDANYEEFLRLWQGHVL